MGGAVGMPPEPKRSRTVTGDSVRNSGLNLYIDGVVGRHSHMRWKVKLVRARLTARIPDTPWREDTRRVISCVERYRFILGATNVGALLLLAIAIALGRVEEKTSYGLVPVVTILAKVALDFSEWAFRNRKEDEKESEKP
jgi:hypothetical protein